MTMPTVRMSDGITTLTPTEHLFLRAALTARDVFPYPPDQPPGFDVSVKERLGVTSFVGPLRSVDLAEAEHAVQCCLAALHADPSFSVDFYVAGSVPPAQSHGIEKHLTSLAALLRAHVEESGGDSLRAQAVARRAQRAVDERDAFFTARDAAGARAIVLSAGELLVVDAALTEASEADPNRSVMGPLTSAELLNEVVSLTQHFALRDLGLRPTRSAVAEWTLSYRVLLNSEEATRVADLVDASLNALPRAWSSLIGHLINERSGDHVDALASKLRAHAARTDTGENK